MTVSFNMYHLSCTSIQYGIYHNDSKFSDRLILAISVDPDQTAPTGAEQSDQDLHCLPFLLHLLDELLYAVKLFWSMFTL